ncbi:hypothetical protein CDAR_232371 [Caerostris darwini]|uniref:Uncharacterized protein n=1 Tax=Caerostris darwini TaxID=1538125 RepID=A0AAV4W6K5_9ARAC|nr:hypothetical protein CDAR_232371 [Caerostris darwini]
MDRIEHNKSTKLHGISSRKNDTDCMLGVLMEKELYGISRILYAPKCLIESEKFHTQTRPTLEFYFRAPFEIEQSPPWVFRQPFRKGLLKILLSSAEWHHETGPYQIFLTP